MALVWLAGCCLCVALSVTHAVFAMDAVDDERLLKAVFVYNFAKFTRWPTHTWPTPDAPLKICTAGRDPLLEGLQLLGGETIGGRPVTIAPLAGTAHGSGCHLLYVALSESGRVTELIELTRAAPVLTVSELPQFAESGGIIQLLREQGRIRFRINLDAARDRGLTLSARLLDLAEVIGGGVGP